MNTQPNRAPEIDEASTLTPINETRADVEAALSFGSFPDHEMRDLLFKCNKLPTQISHFEYKLHLSYVFNQMNEYVKRGLLTKRGRHYEPAPGKEEDGQKIIAAFNEVMKVLRKKDTEEPFILESKAA